MQDTLQKFIFEHHGIRGEIVHLRSAYQAILSCHPYPLPIQILLGEALTATTLLSASIKFEGSFILQTQTQGNIQQMVAQCDNHYHIRGLAMWDETVPPTELALGPGYLAITMVPQVGKDRYQGIVSIENTSINKSIEQYFEQSEQLPTRLWLFANEECAAGLLLQKMPNSGVEDYPQWETACTLAETITPQELLYLPNETLLHRLFYEEDLRLFSPNPISFRCSCTLEKMEKALLHLGHEDALALLSTQKTIAVTCEFCNRSYSFDTVDVTRIFKS